MTLTRDFKQTFVERVERGPDFAKPLLDGEATLLISLPTPRAGQALIKKQ